MSQGIPIREIHITAQHILLASFLKRCCCCYVEFIVAAHVDDDERLSLAQCLISFYAANRAARLYTVIYSYIQAFIGRT